MGHNKRCLWLIFVGITLRAIPISLYEYALPQNSIRTKLNMVFEGHQGSLPYIHDTTWVDFGSWHWSIGRLMTEDNIPFVVKTAKYPANTAITTAQYPGLVQTHTERQNISRIYRALQGQKIITEQQLDMLRVPTCWVYPRSGNNNDLHMSSIADHQVVIVEEMITRKSNAMEWCSHVSDKVQAETLTIDKRTFDQLVTFAQHGTFLDLTPKNLIVDEHDKLFIIDLEDTLAQQKKALDKRGGFLKPLKEFKLRCCQEGYALYGVGVTGLSNTRYEEVRKRGQQLVNKSSYVLCVKKNAFEIVALALVIVGIFAYTIYTMCSTRTIYAYIKKCTQKMRELLSTSDDISQEQYYESAQKAVKAVVPQEYRHAIIQAFATIVIAKHMQKKWDTSHGNITIFDGVYVSPKQAMRKAERKIVTLWRSHAPWRTTTETIKVNKKNNTLGIIVDW